MKKNIILGFVFISLSANSQVGFEQYYSEKQLLAILQLAKTNWDKLEAYGMLAVHYKQTNKDSLAGVYLGKVKAMTAAGILMALSPSELGTTLQAAVKRAGK